MSNRVCVGIVVGVHGVRGAVKVKSFTEVPTDIGYYSPVEDETGSRKIRLKVTGEAKGVVIATLDGIGDRNAAEALKGTRFWIPRERLPRLEEDEFLYSDLVGMAVEGTDGRKLGTVAAVHDFGAGDVLDIALTERGHLMVPFTKAVVPEVDLPGRRLVVIPPLYVAEEDGEGSEVTGGRDS
jgi:16S rRNA processing protein RimM